MLLDLHAWNLATAGLAISAVALLHVVLTCLYNYFFHPLRNLPGPPLARISRLWSRIGNFHGRKSERIHEAHVKYGPVVRVGPNEISFADPAAVQEIYTSNDFTKEETFYVGRILLRVGWWRLTKPKASKAHLSRESSVQL